MHLDRAQRNGFQHLRRQDLAGGDLGAGGVFVSAVDQPRGVQHGQPERDQLGVGVGDELLHQLLVRQQTTLGEAAFRAPRHHLDSALGHPDRAHRVVQPPAGQPSLQDQEALPGSPSSASDGTRTPS